MSLPSITIITPSFKQAAFLERTLLSVIGQNYPKLEYLVFDGGSTDGSVDIIQKYADRITFWNSAKDEGQSDAINKGIARATGDIIGWINSDDTLASDSLWNIGHYYARHPDAEFLYGHVNLIDADDKILKRLYAVPATAKDLATMNRNLFSQPGTTWRRRLTDRIGPLDRSLHYTMDCDLYLRAANATRLHFLPKHLANLRIHGATKSETFRPRFDAEHKILDQRYGKELNGSRAQKIFRLKRLARIAARPSNWLRAMGL